LLAGLPLNGWLDSQPDWLAGLLAGPSLSGWPAGLWLDSWLAGLPLASWLDDLPLAVCLWLAGQPA